MIDTESFLNIFSWLPEVWNFEAFIVDGQPITVRKIINGIALFVVGWFISGTIANGMKKRVFSRFDLDASLQHTLRTMTFYFLLTLLTLFVLNLLNIPVTVFTVLGGAIALGVGLGSQNIVNNFISGLVIMMERPIKVGDIIKVGNLIGTVEYIGARSTRIKSLDNTHMVVPNSSFLEQNILNWTLSDKVVRMDIAVGVAYGSHTKKVEELLKLATEDIEAVLRFPAPSVLFSEFGSSSLDFELHFWMRITDLPQIYLLRSELRHKINTLFLENGITIAFPQKDIHLDTQKPLQVELFNNS